MDIRRCFLLAFLLGIHEVFVQGVTVEADPGGSVILLCSASRYEKDVFWRHERTKTVYDIVDGKVDLTDQDAVYKDRVAGFPLEFAKGNFSIRLRDVKSTDAGAYTCEIPDSKTVRVQLKVKERRDLEPATGSRGGGVTREACGMSLFLLVYGLLCSLAV